MYQAWGDFVASEIFRNISLDEASKQQLLKLPVKVRLKKEASIRAKIARYNLTNPEAEITDLVGVRFVVLLTSDLNLIECAIQNNAAWRAEKSRDFLAQTKANPELFDYQSIHYAVTSSSDIDLGAVTVKSGVTCEVQIRTLLQHAYAELTHDNIYKPVHAVPPSAKRFVARSMALMETTDDLFCRTLHELQIANQPRNDFYAELQRLFSELVYIDTEKFDERTNLEIFEFFDEYFSYDSAQSKIESFWVANATLLTNIQNRTALFLFSQPAILFIYWLAHENDHAVRTHWPYGSLIEELRLIFSDLGIALGDQL